MYAPCKIKNDTAGSLTFVGQQIQPGAYFEVDDFERPVWAKDPDVAQAINDGDLIVNDYIEDLDAIDGLSMLQDTNARKRLTFSFGDNENPECRVKGTSWKAVRRMIFRGSNRDGSPKVLLTATMGDGTGGDIRLYDATNGNTIFSGEISDGNYQVTKHNPLSNIPTGNALFEIQMKSDSAGKYVYITAADLIW